MRKQYKNLAFIFVLILLMINFVRTPSLYKVHIFSLIYVILFYWKLTNTTQDFIYSCCILFIFNTMGSLINVGACCVLYLISTLLENKDKISNKEFYIKYINKYSVFSLIFLAYMTFSVFGAEFKGIAMKFLLSKYFIGMLIVFIVVIYNSKMKNINNTLVYLNFLLIGILCLGFLEIFGFNLGLPNVYSDMGFYKYYIDWIPEVFYYNPNNFAIIITLAILMFIIKEIYSERKKISFVYLIAFLVCEFEMIFTRSRICWMTFFIMLVLLIVYHFLFKFHDKFKLYFSFKVIKYWIFAVVLFMSLSFIPNMQPFYSKIINNPISKFASMAIQNALNMENYEAKEDEDLIINIQVGGEGSESERFTLIYDVINGVIREKNYFGFGPGNTEQYIKSLDNTSGIINIHSFWFEILGDFGIFIFFYLIVIYVNNIIDILTVSLKAKFQERKNIVLVLFWSVAIVLLGFVSSSPISFLPVWFIMALGFSVSFHKKDILKELSI